MGKGKKKSDAKKSSVKSGKSGYSSDGSSSEESGSSSSGSGYSSEDSEGSEDSDGRRVSKKDIKPILSSRKLPTVVSSKSGNVQFYRQPQEGNVINAAMGMYPQTTQAMEATYTYLPPEWPPKPSPHLSQDQRDEDGLDFNFLPKKNFATEVTFTIEPRKKPMWQKMMSCGFKPMITCSAPPFCLPPNYGENKNQFLKFPEPVEDKKEPEEVENDDNASNNYDISDVSSQYDYGGSRSNNSNANYSYPGSYYGYGGYPYYSGGDGSQVRHMQVSGVNPAGQASFNNYKMQNMNGGKGYNGYGQSEQMAKWHMQMRRGYAQNMQNKNFHQQQQQPSSNHPGGQTPPCSVYSCGQQLPPVQCNRTGGQFAQWPCKTGSFPSTQQTPARRPYHGRPA